MYNTEQVLELDDEQLKSLGRAVVAATLKSWSAPSVPREPAVAVAVVVEDELLSDLGVY